MTRLLRGEPLETRTRELTLTAARLSEWRDRALAAAEAAMKERERDARDDEILRLKAKLGEVTMASRSYNSAKSGFEWTARFERGALRRLYGAEVYRERRFGWAPVTAALSCRSAEAPGSRDWC